MIDHCAYNWHWRKALWDISLCEVGGALMKALYSVDGINIFQYLCLRWQLHNCSFILQNIKKKSSAYISKHSIHKNFAGKKRVNKFKPENLIKQLILKRESKIHQTVPTADASNVFNLMAFCNYIHNKSYFPGNANTINRAHCSLSNKLGTIIYCCVFQNVYILY